MSSKLDDIQIQLMRNLPTREERYEVAQILFNTIDMEGLFEGEFDQMLVNIGMSKKELEDSFAVVDGINSVEFTELCSVRTGSGDLLSWEQIVVIAKLEYKLRYRVVAWLEQETIAVSASSIEYYAMKSGGKHLSSLFGSLEDAVKSFVALRPIMAHLFYKAKELGLVDETDFQQRFIVLAKLLEERISD